MRARCRLQLLLVAAGFRLPHAWASPPEAAQGTAPPTEVVVHGAPSEATRREKSAEAVTIVRLDDAKKRTADMGEVLARAPGLIVSRSGGLGSDLRLSINGLVGPAVRVFLDGVPLEMSGYPRNVGAIPVNLISHVEIHRGVVPLRLAADALGGAVNLVSDRSYETRLALAYQEGSFGTHRATALVQHHTAADFVLRLAGYADRSKNDYFVDVQIPNDRGQLSPARVPLPNNQYSAIGATVDAGFVGKRWAKRLLLRSFYSGSEQEHGANLVMTIPYGEVRENHASAGAQLIYEVEPDQQSRFEQVTSYSHTAASFLDVSSWVYDWRGNRGRERLEPGEIDGTSYDLVVWDNAIFSRTLFEWSPREGHVFLLNATPKFTSRTGDDRQKAGRDALSAASQVFSGTFGLGHEWNVLPFPGPPEEASQRGALRADRSLRYRLQNLISLKGYTYAVGAEELRPGGSFVNRDRALAQFGISDALRYSLDPHWSLKLSYEYATRLPDSWEVFGNGALVQANLQLTPEVSHNFNMGPIFEAQGGPVGDWMAMLNGGIRDADNMIVLLGDDRFYTYQNVYHAVSLFAEGAVRWVSPQRYLTLDGAFTADDVRNQSDSGPFASFKGERLPNRTPLSSSWTARLSFGGVFLARDRLETFYAGRFLAGFFRGWESQGLADYKQHISDQASHSAGLSYTLTTDRTRITNTVEVQNFTDERLSDLYGQQRPGRAVYWKLLGELF